MGRRKNDKEWIPGEARNLSMEERKEKFDPHLTGNTRSGKGLYRTAIKYLENGNPYRALGVWIQANMAYPLSEGKYKDLRAIVRSNYDEEVQEVFEKVQSGSYTREHLKILISGDDPEEKIMDKDQAKDYLVDNGVDRRIDYAYGDIDKEYPGSDGSFLKDDLDSIVEYHDEG